MNKQSMWFAFLLSLVALVAVSCSDDDNDSPTGPNGGTEASVDMSSVAIEVPSAMATAANNNNGAATARDFILQMNTFRAYSSWWTPPAGKLAPSAALQNGGKHQWSMGGVTVTLETSNSGSAFLWKVWLDGNDGEMFHDNFLFIEGIQESGENTGNMSINNPDSPGSALMYWEWATSPLNIFTVDMMVNDEGFDLNAQINPDGSGSISQSIGTVTTFEAAWTSSGAGTYTFRDGQGQVTNSGSWPGM